MPRSGLDLDAFRARHRRRLRVAAGSVAAWTLTAPAVAQSNFNQWITPGGGSWNSPRNWSLEFVPTWSTDAYFRLDDDLAITTSGAAVFELLVEGSRVDLTAPACSAS